MDQFTCSMIMLKMYTNQYLHTLHQHQNNGDNNDDENNCAGNLRD